MADSCLVTLKRQGVFWGKIGPSTTSVPTALRYFQVAARHTIAKANNVYINIVAQALDPARRTLRRVHSLA